MWMAVIGLRSMQMTKIYYFTTSVCLVYKIKTKIAFGTSLFFHTCKIQLYIFRENGPAIFLKYLIAKYTRFKLQYNISVYTWFKAN